VETDYVSPLVQWEAEMMVVVTFVAVFATVVNVFVTFVVIFVATV
jgi:hypothetical protein